MNNKSLLDLIACAAKYSITLKEIEVLPEQHKLMVEEALLVRRYDAKVGAADLYVYDVLVKPKECKGCCEHKRYLGGLL